MFDKLFVLANGPEVVFNRVERLHFIDRSKEVDINRCATTYLSFDVCLDAANSSPNIGVLSFLEEITKAFLIDHMHRCSPLKRFLLLLSILFNTHAPHSQLWVRTCNCTGLDFLIIGLGVVALNSLTYLFYIIPDEGQIFEEDYSLHLLYGQWIVLSGHTSYCSRSIGSTCCHWVNATLVKSQVLNCLQLNGCFLIQISLALRPMVLSG